MARHTTLISLPAEMQQAIAAQAEPHDLLALRLCCRDTYAAAEDHFIEAFFTKRSHIYTRGALEALVEITADTRLVKKIRVVEFVTVQPSWFRFPSNKVLHAVKGYDSVIRKWNNAHSELVDAGVAADLILQIFSNLSTAQVVPTISVCSHTRVATSSSFGIPELGRMLGYEVKLTDREAAYECSLSCAIIAAIVTTELPITALVFEQGADICGVKIGRHNMIKAIAKKATRSASLQGLRSLTINIDSNRYGAVNETFLTWLFTSAASLQHLAISEHAHGDNHHNHEHLFTVLGKASSASRLTSIDIISVEASPPQYLRLLGLLKHTLKQLTLQDIELPLDNLDCCWSPVFEWLAKKLSLERVTMKQLTLFDGSTFAFDLALAGMQVERVDKSHCVLQGEEQVKRGLGQLAETPKYYLSDGEIDDGAMSSDDDGSIRA